MDSLQGIPVEYKLDTFQAQLYVTPKLAMSTRYFYPALDTLAINSPLGHFNGDNAYSPQITETKLTVTSKVQFLQLQHVFP